MTREDRLDELAMEAMKAAIVNGGIVNTYALALNSYTVASEMLNRRHLILEQMILGDMPSMLVEELAMTVRTSNCLKEAKIFTIGQLQQWTAVPSPSTFKSETRLGKKYTPCVPPQPVTTEGSSQHLQSFCPHSSLHPGL